MDYFTYITGIATIIGFVMQIFNVLPSFRPYRQGASLLSLGLFIGSLFNALDGSNIQFNITITVDNVLIFAVIMLICMLFGVSLYVTQQNILVPFG